MRSRKPEPRAYGPQASALLAHWVEQRHRCEQAWCVLVTLSGLFTDLPVPRDVRRAAGDLKGYTHPNLRDRTRLKLFHAAELSDLADAKGCERTRAEAHAIWDALQAPARKEAAARARKFGWT